MSFGISESPFRRLARVVSLLVCALAFHFLAHQSEMRNPIADPDAQAAPEELKVEAGWSLRTSQSPPEKKQQPR